MRTETLLENRRFFYVPKAVQQKIIETAHHTGRATHTVVYISDIGLFTNRLNPVRETSTCSLIRDTLFLYLTKLSPALTL